MNCYSCGIKCERNCSYLQYLSQGGSVKSPIYVNYACAKYYLQIIISNLYLCIFLCEGYEKSDIEQRYDSSMVLFRESDVVGLYNVRPHK